jgi:hypothetical protein
LYPQDLGIAVPDDTRDRDRMINRILALAAVLVGLAVLLPTTASAGNARCDVGEFCLYYWFDLTQGIYNFSGNDPNLNNDRFEGAHTGQTVGNFTLSVWNRGTPVAKRDVLVYSNPGYKGGPRCVVQGAIGNLSSDYWNTIESYKWVTRAECNRNIRMRLTQ